MSRSRRRIPVHRAHLTAPSRHDSPSGEGEKKKALALPADSRTAVSVTCSKWACRSARVHVVGRSTSPSQRPSLPISAINRHRQFALLHAAARARAKGNVDGAWSTQHVKGGSHGE